MRQDTDERTIVLFPDRTWFLKNLLPSLPTVFLIVPVIRAWKSGTGAGYLTLHNSGAA
ncbi:MAG TPA: hypothetical protein VKV40_12620 [Ktedonobacteraceae bacterium]|nr:hypothetical protein [Ktedonobacteraceae bacterium]